MARSRLIPEKDARLEQLMAGNLGGADHTLEHELFELHRAMHELSERVSRIQRRAADGHR